MTKDTAQARHKPSRVAALEEMSLQTSAKSRQRGCGRYVLRQTVPHVCGGDRKSSVADGWHLTDAYGGRPVMKMALNEGDVVGWDPPTGRVYQQGTTVLLHVRTCIQGQQAWSQFAPQPWASATDGGAEWCGRTLSKKTPLGQPSSSPTGAASANTAGFQKEWRYPCMSLFQSYTSSLLDETSLKRCDRSSSIHSTL